MLVEVPGVYGTPVYVDPDRIVAVVPAADDTQGCVLLLDGNWRVGTTWTYADLTVNGVVHRHS